LKSLLLLGSTGSIGTQTLDLVRASKSAFRVRGLAAARSWQALAEQARELLPDVVAIADPDAAAPLADALPAGVALRAGPEAALELASELDYDLAVHGMVGAAGVLPSAAVLSRGLVLALANKESLVVAGERLMELARSAGATLLPVDSEHSGIFQCLRGEDVARVRRVYLTASGGPFRDLGIDELDAVTPEMALRHPTWDMGPRITIGSATLMNKALEIVEAHHLFGLAEDQIAVVIHRQSIVHSMVELCDGSVLAQMGPPDMRGPIHFALHHPRRASNASLTGFDPALFRELTFDTPDPARYPALELGYRCVREGGFAGCVLNAADEVAVEAFLGRAIGFQDICGVGRTVLDRSAAQAPAGTGLAPYLEADARARDLARREVAGLVGALK
jgi:1-deoxy-D-xylulose-5-phosphate reductoisomerase